MTLKPWLEEWYLIVGIFKRFVAEFKRYYLNTISFFITITIIFYLIVLGFKSFGGGAPNITGSLQSTAIGYFTWIMVVSVLTELSWNLMNEMNRGIIEQIFLSPFGPIKVYSFGQIVSLIINIPFLYLVMLVIFKMAKLKLIVPPAFFLNMFFLLLQTYGFGMILGGITLKFKRTQALLQISQFAIIGLLVLNPEGKLGFMIPISPHFMIFRMIMNGENVGMVLWLKVFTASLIYYYIGTRVFAYFVRVVKKNGELSIY
ncbi:MAG: hypothetical protein DRP30_04225 [Thermotoga sp.]|nr:MAG: hypothetical protein DRP30_04225 [Thermotoga sp.]